MNVIDDNEKNIFICLLLTQFFELGYESEADKHFKKLLDKYNESAKEWLYNLFNDNFKDTFICLGVLQVLSHLDYDDIEPYGLKMIISASQHKDIEIKEYVIRVCENWGNKESLKCLEELKIYNIYCPYIPKNNDNWLKEYYCEVIKDIKKDIL